MFAQADLAQAVVEVIKDQQRAGQDKAGFGLIRHVRAGGGQLRVEQRRGFIAEVAIQGAGDGREIRLRREFQAAHHRAHAVRKGHVGAVRQAFQARIADVKGEASAPAGERQGEIAAKHAVPPPAAVHFRAFQQKGFALAGDRQEKADRRVCVRNQVTDALRQGDAGGIGRFCRVRAIAIPGERAIRDVAGSGNGGHWCSPAPDCA